MSLNKEEELFLTQHTFNNTPYSIFWFNFDGSIIYVNDKCCEALKYSKDELLNMNIQDIFYNLKQEDLINIISDLNNNKTILFESFQLSKKGDKSPVEISADFLKYKKSEFYCFISRNIKQYKDLEKKLNIVEEKAKESDRLKAAFLATMSHELRTPLNAVIGFSDLILDTDSIEEIHRYCKTINKSGHHLLSIIEDLFDISNIESGMVSLRKDIYDIIPILNDVYKTICLERTKSRKEHINIDLIYDKKLDKLLIETDRTRLTQVLLNILKNAIKFTLKGSVKFGFELKENYIELFVKDTGIGIPEEKQNIIFEKFRQVDDSHTRKVGGTGLGLSICKKLVNLLGGKIWMESIIDIGSTFYLTIPYEKPVDKIEIKTPLDWSDKTILIVEDVETNYQFIYIGLAKTKVKTLWSKDAAQSIVLCRDNKDIDLILMDLQLPDMNGLDATKIIREFRKDIPIIAQTAHALTGDREKSLNAGCDEYVSKPINRKELIQKITKLLDHK